VCQSHLSPFPDISESVFCMASGLYARSQFVTKQETPQTRSIALSAAHSLYMGTYTPKHSLVWMHRGFRFLPCPLPQGCFNRIPSFSRKEDCFGAQIHQNSACQQLRKSIISSQNFKRIMEINAIFYGVFQNIFDRLGDLYILARCLEFF